ncbi:MAG: PQQ-like domain [Acidimicrobiales bacterium]|nr:PQQ-like domain [Acidimicrobiales bacterium]
MADNSLCDGCGTVLPLPEEEGGAVLCPSCGRVDRTTHPAPAAVAEPMVASESVATSTPVGSYQVVTTTFTTNQVLRTGSSIGCLIGLVVLLAVGGGIFAVVKGLSEGTGPFAGLKASSLYPSSGSTIVVPGEGAGTDVIVMATDNSDDSARKLVRAVLGEKGGEETWRSAALPKDMYSANLVIDGDHLWVGGESHLLLLSLETGAQQWATTLTDNLTTGCTDCFTVVGGTLVLRTNDAYVSAFAPATKEPRWSRRLQSPSASLTRAGAGVFVVDEPADGTAVTEIIKLDPATGKTLKTFRPTCPSSDFVPYPVEMSGADPIRAIPETGDLVTWFGFGYGCVTRFDATTGQVKWATGLPSGNFGEEAVINKGNLVFERSSGSPLRVDLADGRVTELEAVPDANALPRAITGRILLGETASTRGTTKGGLAAWDLRTGKRLWSVRLPGSSQPISRSAYRSSDALSEGDIRTLLVVDGPATRLVSFVGSDRSIRVQPLDPASGELGEARTDEIRSRHDSGGTPSITVESATGGRLVVGVDSIVEVVDLDGGGAVSWPPKN